MQKYKFGIFFHFIQRKMYKYGHIQCKNINLVIYNENVQKWLYWMQKIIGTRTNMAMAGAKT